MTVFLLLTTIFCTSTQNVTVRAFGNKTDRKGLYLFSSLSRMFGLLFFALTAGGLSFDRNLLPYAISFGFFYGIGVVFHFLSINCGPLALTSLINSYCLMLPTVFGLLFFHDPIRKGFVFGLVFLLVSLFLINQKNEKHGGMKISLKWTIFVTLAFLGNGCCSIVQSIQQRVYDGGCKNEFMIIALLFFIFITGTLSLCTERKEMLSCTKKAWLPAVICGLANALMNLLVMTLQSRMPVSLLFPMMSAGGLVLTYFLSKFLYRETLSKRQLAGFVLGVLSVIFLTL